MPGRHRRRTSLAAMTDTDAAHQPTRSQSSESTRIDQADLHDRRAKCTMMTQRQLSLSRCSVMMYECRW
jgi:hypothetical protein